MKKQETWRDVVLDYVYIAFGDLFNRICIAFMLAVLLQCTLLTLHI